jgi:ribonucleotide reductase beta subunit family protein with ferritin-like domain
MAEVDKRHTDSLTNATRQVFMRVLTFEIFSDSRKVNSLKEP